MRISNEDSSVSFKLCLNSWECCQNASPSPPLSSATTMKSEEPDRLENECIFPSNGSNTGEEIIGRDHVIQSHLEYFIIELHNYTSREFCSNLAWLQVPADFPRVEGLASGHDWYRLYLHSNWGNIKLPADSSHRRAFCSSYVHLQKEIPSGKDTYSCMREGSRFFYSH